MNTKPNPFLSLFLCNLSLPKKSELIFPPSYSPPPPCWRYKAAATTTKKKNMKRYQQRNAVAVCEERRIDSVICPKPRRLGILNPSVHDPIRPHRLSVNIHQGEIGDSKAGAELLDIILTTGGYGGEKPSNQVASSPPYFCGSPPSRASNPVIKDTQFGNEKIAPFSPVAPLSPSSRMAGGCTRMKFGHVPAAVRVEGFDCLSRDRRSCSISAVA